MVMQSKSILTIGPRSDDINSREHLDAVAQNSNS